MKLVLIFPLIVILFGCSASPHDQQQLFDNEVHKTESGKKLTVNKLKENYLKETGQQLIANGTADCGWDGNCYYNKWANAYDNGINEFRNNRYQMQQKEIEKCNASLECSKEREISKYSSELNTMYLYALSQNRYLQAQYDSMVRITCREAGKAQRKGLTKEGMNENIRLAEGLSPQQRYIVNGVSGACWELSKNGIQDGTVKISTFY